MEVGLRKLILSILLATLAISSASARTKVTVDPNTPGARATGASSTDLTDARLKQKITYRAKLRPISDLTDDLTKLTGVTFIAGRSAADWRMREDCCTIIAKDVPLSTLMTSISHVMKFAWARAGKAPHWAYRLVEDRDEIAKVRRLVAEQKKQDAEVRRQCWERTLRASRMSLGELAAIKESDPTLYLCAEIGELKPLVEFLQSTPDVRDALLSGKELYVPTSSLSPSSRRSLMQAARADFQFQSLVDGTDDPRSKEYYASTIRQIDSGELGQRMLLTVREADHQSPVAGVLLESAKAACLFSLGRPPKSEAGRLSASVNLRAYEEKRRWMDVFSEMRPRIIAARKKESQIWVQSDTQEPLIEHGEDPALQEPLKEKIEPKVITRLVESLADTTGFAFVTDDFRGRTGMKFEQGTPLRKALDTISEKSQYYNWNRNARVVELWHVNWYDRREARLSKAWLEAMRRSFKTDGTLDIDDLAEIASLTDAQMDKNIWRDDVLKFAADTVFSTRDYLKVYASLTPDQRSGLLSTSGAAFADLTTDQQASITKLISMRCDKAIRLLGSLDLGALGIRITSTRESQGKRYVYTLKAQTSLGEIPGQYRFRTPLYVEPPKPPSPKS